MKTPGYKSGKLERLRNRYVTSSFLLSVRYTYSVSLTFVLRGLQMAWYGNNPLQFVFFGLRVRNDGPCMVESVSDDFGLCVRDDEQCMVESVSD